MRVVGGVVVVVVKEEEEAICSSIQRGGESLFRFLLLVKLPAIIGRVRDGGETGGGFASFAKFPTTRWSAIRGMRSTVEEERKRSWDAIVAAYWRPAYKHVRVKWKKEQADAEDLVQSFFARTVERDVFADYDPAKGRFRTFVRVCLDRFVSNERKAAGREKRGGDVQHTHFDFEGAESELARVARAEDRPDDLFDREWERALFASAIEQLRAECEANDKRDWFAVFEKYDLAEEKISYEDLGRELGVPATTVTNRLSYARRELRRLVVERLERVTATDAELATETKLLFG
jgi:RNA polymerase sigma factor (sigma-70 family)